jgi:DNA gyrase subunit A
MLGFGIDQQQAEFVAEIRLRNINREYILKRTAEIADLERDIEELESVLNNRRKLKGIIIDELRQISKKYGSSRRTGIVYAHEIEEFSEEQTVEDYGVTLFLSREGYFKKITAQSLRMSGEQKFKEGDALSQCFETTNRAELLLLTDHQQMYKARVSDFEDGKASQLGIYLPTKLQFDEGESILAMILPGDYTKHLLLVFENGKAARIEMSAYETKTNRKKLVNACSDKSPVKAVLLLEDETDVACFSSDGRVLIFNTAQLQPKSSRTTQGVNVMSLKAKRTLDKALPLSQTSIVNTSRYRVKTLPGAGALLKNEDRTEQQLSLLD